LGGVRLRCRARSHGAHHAQHASLSFHDTSRLAQLCCCSGESPDDVTPPTFSASSEDEPQLPALPALGPQLQVVLVVVLVLVVVVVLMVLVI
jgi:hypothetical protein